MVHDLDRCIALVLVETLLQPQCCIFDTILVYGLVDWPPGATRNVWHGGSSGGPPLAPLSPLPICTAAGNCDISCT